MKIIRWILGRIILLLNFLFAPKRPKRTAEAQQQLDRETRQLVLYQFQACPFCVRVRRSMRRLGLNIETRDANRNPDHRQELLQGGGEVKVPCLRIDEANGETRWMYESADIIAYLQQRFANA